MTTSTTVPSLAPELSLRGFAALLRPKKAMLPRARRIARALDEGRGWTAMRIDETKKKGGRR